MTPLDAPELYDPPEDESSNELLDDFYRQPEPSGAGRAARDEGAGGGGPGGDERESGSAQDLEVDGGEEGVGGSKREDRFVTDRDAAMRDAGDGGGDGAQGQGGGEWEGKADGEEGVMSDPLLDEDVKLLKMEMVSACAM